MHDRKKHMLAVAWATWGGSFAPWGAAAPQTPPLFLEGLPPHRLPWMGCCRPPSQHVFLFDRAFGWEGLPGVPEGPPSLKQIVNTGQSSAIVTPGRSPCDRAPCRPNCFGRSANDTGRIPKWAVPFGSNPPWGIWGAAAPQPGGSGGREPPQNTGSVLSAETLPQEHIP